MSLVDPYLQGIQVNPPFQDFQMWPPVHLQAGPWLQEVLEDHPSHWDHQNSVLEFLELPGHLFVQGNLWRTEHNTLHVFKVNKQQYCRNNIQPSLSSSQQAENQLVIPDLVAQAGHQIQGPPFLPWNRPALDVRNLRRNLADLLGLRDKQSFKHLQ